MIYRMAIKASVCLSVEANSEEEAFARVKEITEANYEGIDLDLSLESAIDPGERLYFCENEDIDVVSVENVESV